MKESIRQAFLESRDGYSADRVIADPDLNRTFVRRCHNLNIEASTFELNKSLLNARKQGSLAGLPGSRRTSFKDESDYSHAAEIAVRYLERRYEITLDDILCDPNVAVEFDKIAQDVYPGKTILQYRWAALNLRKRRDLIPEIISRALPIESVSLGRIETIDLLKIPQSQGLYIFHTAKETLYIGESKDLRQRVSKHLDHSDNKNLARWFWDNGNSGVLLEVQVLAIQTPTKVRRALEVELIRSRTPLFNVASVV